MTDKPFDVTGLGNAIMDVLVSATDTEIEALGVAKGAMTLIDEPRAIELYEAMDDAVETPGGSVANSIAGLGAMGAKTAFMGRIRDDAVGRSYATETEKSGTAFMAKAAPDGPSTGRCMIYVTPDAHRTMNTFLGAGSHFGERDGDLDLDVIKQSKVLYLEGYLFDTDVSKKAMRLAAQTAKQAGGKVALSLSDPFCVSRHRADFFDLVADSVDILFANEEEAHMLFEIEGFDNLATAAHNLVDIAVVTRSEKGASLMRDGVSVHVDAAPQGEVIDTTGAGDQFSAGVLYGLVNGFDLELSGRLGSLAAGEVISHFGPRPAQSIRELAQAKGLL